ncbi:phage tail length tape measure family protein [Sphingomonas sp. PB4P5]|uniref:phage tail length tape measure family protein n=1 Tax=Parasphingomonas puruogangriensis TaxID=3096155 RepID=UPI002FC9EF9B
MAVTADSVVVKLTAEVDEATGKVRKYAADFDREMAKVGNSATRSDLVVRGASDGIVNSSRQIANGTRNLGRQIADVGASLASGSSPFLILAQQAPQVADALADTGGKAAVVARFFAGPWGAALLAAGSVAGVLFGKLLEGGMTVETLTKKLEENAEKTRLTAQAEDAFRLTAEGAADAVRKLNEEMTKQLKTQDQLLAGALRAAQAYRQIAIQAQNSREQILALRVAEAKTAANRPIFAGGPGGGSGLAQIPYLKAQAQAEKDLAKAKGERAAAEKQVALSAIPILDARAAAATDKSAAATDRHARALGKLRDAYVAASVAAKTNAEREAATRNYRQGRERIDTGLAREQKAISDGNKKGPKGRSAESIARAAEVARVREVRNNEAYNNELEQLNQGIIDAKRATETDVAALANYARDDVASELKKRLASIDADESAKKYDAAQAETLRGLARQRATLQELNISSEEIRRRSDEQNAVTGATLRNQQDLLQAQGSISESNAERREIELKLLDLKYQELRIAQQAILGDTTGRYNDTQRKIAQDRLNALPALQAAEQTGVAQRGRSQFDAYRANLTSVDGLQDSIDAIKIDALEAVTEELADAAQSALGLKGALGDIVGELIKIGIQRAIIGPLADSLFGPAGGAGAGGGSGSLGSIFSAVGSIFGRASGGYVGAGNMVRVNEGASPGNVEGWRPMGSGTVIPLGQMKATRAGGNTVVHAPQFNLKGAVVTAELYADMQRISQDSAATAGRIAYKQSINDAPGAVARRQTLRD